MSARKGRFTVTVDPELIEAGNDAVAKGKAESLSAWVNAALAERVARERRLVALAQAVTGYEKRFGAISVKERAEQARVDRESAVLRRGKSAAATKRKAPQGQRSNL
jgi:hypothetical protein